MFQYILYIYINCISDIYVFIFISIYLSDTSYQYNIEY